MIKMFIRLLKVDKQKKTSFYHQHFITKLKEKKIFKTWNNVCYIVPRV